MLKPGNLENPPLLPNEDPPLEDPPLEDPPVEDPPFETNGFIAIGPLVYCDGTT